MDITKCKSNNCSIKEKCFRFSISESTYNQSYIIVDADEVKEESDCDYFIQK